MKAKALRVIGYCLLVTVLILGGVRTVSAIDGIETIREYLDLIVSGNIESAGYMWTMEAQERSSRFGITYDDVPLKVDCNSPVVRNIPVMRSFIEPPVRQHEILSPDSNFVRYRYSHLVHGELIEHDYYAFFDGQHYWLTYAQDFYTQGWPTVETEFFRIRYQPSLEANLNPVALDAADAEMEVLARQLKLDKDDMKALRENKVEYVYCDSDTTVEDITGHRAEGMLDLPSNDIISAFFPHYHELVHLLVAIKLETLPLYTQPLLREGVAVHFGGRWGKAPATMVDLGAFLYHEDIIHPDSLLTMRGFERNAVSDIAYPLAGLFTAFLIDDLGQDKYFKLYRHLSGPFADVYKWSSDEVRSRILETTGHDSWEALIADFDAFVDTQISELTAASPGALDGGKMVADLDSIVITHDKHWVAFDIRTGAGAKPNKTILFAYDERLSDQPSKLYGEQFLKGDKMDGYRFGVRVDQNEAGLYDYATNSLMAKYIWGISPSPDYFDETENRITIKFRRELFGDHLPTAESLRIVSQ